MVAFKDDVDDQARGTRKVPVHRRGWQIETARVCPEDACKDMTYCYS